MVGASKCQKCQSISLSVSKHIHGFMGVTMSIDLDGMVEQQPTKNSKN